MASWILVPSLVSLRTEFNRLSPGRDKASDGSIGDVAHQHEKSDHNPDETGSTPTKDADSINEVHAIDTDNNLRKPGWTMDRALQIIILRHRNGQDDRLQNVIYNRRIWSRSWGWTARVYNGASAHTEHAHFSARYGSGSGSSNPENNTKPWGLLAADAPKEDELPEVQDVLNGLHGDLLRGPDFKATKDFPAGESGLHKDVRLIAEAAVKPLETKLDTVIALLQSGATSK
jgi:hypothetical protein